MFGAVPFGGVTFAAVLAAGGNIFSGIEAADVFEAEGSVLVVGDFVASEEVDTLESSGTVGIFGLFEVVEEEDSFSGAAEIRVEGDWSSVEPLDKFKVVSSTVLVEETRTYVPSIPPIGLPEDVQILVQYLNDELAMIAQFINEEKDIVSFEVMRFPPKRPRQGMVVYADGSDWDPGSGEGLYRYSGSGWEFVG